MGRVRGSGNGFILLHPHSSGGVWKFHWHEYLGDKRRHRAQRMGTIVELPTREAAEVVAATLRMKHRLGKSAMRTMSKQQKKYMTPICSPQQYESKVIEQEGRCAICNVPTFRLVIDHDHASGRLRGLLCSQCNSALGFLQDNPNICRAAATYLELHLSAQLVMIRSQNLV